ncbi:MAG: MBL fold metallo-hydrolase [Bacteroidota bacterium]
MKVKFCGAAREVTGSAHVLTLDDGFKILLDCGLYQGNDDDMEDFNSTWKFDPQEINCVILSHAHIDHSGRLPKLIKDGYRGPIFSTHATRSLCSIMLLDSAFIQERDAAYYNKKNKDKKKRREPLYNKKHVTQTMDRFISYSYGRTFEVYPGVKVTFRDAGHILGSASVHLRIKDKNGDTVNFGFTGDIGRPNRPILRDPQIMDPVDYLICESTYGDKEHEGAPKEIEKLLQIIHHTCVEKKGKLIIPAFSVGRTQEIVYIMDQLENAGRLPRIPVYVDSPLAVNATTIFGSHPECYDAELSSYILKDPNPFGFNNLTYIKEVAHSKRLNGSRKPCVIISASGMANAGRVKHHIFNNISNPRNTVLIVGYCAPQTPGGRLRDGVDELKLYGQVKKVKAEVAVMDSFSAHGDRSEMYDFVRPHNKTLKKLFMVHGEINRQEKFREYLKEKGMKCKIEIPVLGQEYNVY